MNTSSVPGASRVRPQSSNGRTNLFNQTSVSRSNNQTGSGMLARSVSEANIRPQTAPSKRAELPSRPTSGRMGYEKPWIQNSDQYKEQFRQVRQVKESQADAAKSIKSEYLPNVKGLRLTDAKTLFMNNMTEMPRFTHSAGGAGSRSKRMNAQGDDDGWDGVIIDDDSYGPIV